MRKVFSYLALLNLFDGTVTFWGLRFSFIEESNPLMNGLYEVNPLYFLGYKVLLSGFLCAMVIYNKLPTIQLVKVLSVAASILYTIVSVFHGVLLIPVIIEHVS